MTLVNLVVKNGLQCLVKSLKSLQPFLIFTWIALLSSSSTWEVMSHEIATYVWYTGEWKPCQSDTCGGLGSTHRLVTCMDTHSNTTAVHPRKCAGQAPQPSAHSQCYRICDFHRYQYKWTASAWSPCQQQGHYGTDRCKDGQNYGLQHRNVSCVARCSGTAPDHVFCSSFYPKPIASRLCSITCPKDCVTGEYGSWTKCDSCFRRYKGRYKAILRAPADSGQECGDLVDYQPCSLKQECYDNRASNFQYKLGDWTKCQAPDGKLRRKLRHFSSILGHQTRSVQCVDVHGALVDERVCSFTSKRPLDHQLCVIPRDCLVSHWTNWSNWTATGQPYPLGTTSRDPYRTRDQEVLTRNRNLIQVPHGQGGACPVLIDRKEKEGGEEKKAEPCDRYTWLEGEWGVCEPQLTMDRCGTGVQSRAVICVQVIDKIPVADYQCATAAPVHTRLCVRPCHSDCRVSSWGAWGQCLPDLCTVLTTTKPGTGYRTRKRDIANMDVNQKTNGECPHLEESQPCEYTACYQWLTESSVCELRYKDMTCGEGILKTRRKCVDIRGVEVPADQCPRVLHTQTCHVPCGGDCVLSEWSSWSPCPVECDPYGHLHHRTRTRHVLARPSREGVQCPPEKQRQELSRCPRHSCETYHWKATPWGRCRLKANSEHRREEKGVGVGHVTCGAGSQDRDAYCYREDGRSVAHKKCPDSTKPEVTRDCLLPCPVSCQVSQFSDWSPCAGTCLPDGGPVPSQRRRRFILSTSHTQSCSYLEESKECKHLPTCETYQWDVSDWSSCMTPQKCGVGYRARDVVCMNQRSDKLPEEMCISLLGSKPESVQACKVEDCQATCILSDWTTWTSCSQRCNGVRRRSRTMEGESSKIQLCHDSIKYPLHQKQHCNQCTQYREMPLGRWSSCLLVANRTDTGELVPISMLRSNRNTCGIGNRYQALICNDGRGQNISASACYSKDFVEEVCFTPCPMDCVLSQWSEWSQCTTQNRCGNGRRTRYRYVEEQALDGGRSCDLDGSEQYDHQPCHIPCETYFWQTGQWSPCSIQIRLEKTEDCGIGLKYRTNKCMKQSDWPGDDPIEVSMSHCDALSKPHTDSNCSVPCTGHCVMSQWSEWTQCTPTCQGQRKRARTIARKPSPGIHTSCDHLQEIQECSLGTNCFEYSLAWSDWGQCLLPVGRDCGMGYRVSYSECVRSDRSPVHRSYCLLPDEKMQSHDVSHMMKESCTVPCPVDCVVSEWTAWSLCSVSCGLGYQERFRHVVIPPQYNGRECPRDLFEERPCSFTECFHWRVSDWEECYIPESSCGVGIETRQLHCYRQDGLQVDRSLCHQGETTHFQLTRSCHVPCPGDCWLSHWSEWGSCDRPCVQGIVEGVQTRSRAVVSPPSESSSATTTCPHPLLETRPCVGGMCHTYQWQTSFWYGDNRNVWCERSDKVTVFGGCDLSKRPSSVRRCSPACSVPHSYCVDVDRCICTAKFKATYDETGETLVTCSQDRVMQNNNSELVETKQFLPEDGSTNFWMYAVIAAGSAFIIFVVVAIYFILKHSRRDQLNEMSMRGHGSTITRKHQTMKTSNDGLPDKSPTPSKLKTFTTRTENEYT